jgi:hypothetical protein
MQAQKTRFGQGLPYAKPGTDYPIKVHISDLKYRPDYVGNDNTLGSIYATAVIAGKKVELRGTQVAPSEYKLLFGDMQARLLKDPEKTGDTMLFQEYEAVLSDKHVWQFTVTGISE